MIQVCGHLDLLEEPLASQRFGELGVEDLHRDRASVLHIRRQVHSRHSASTDLAFQLVSVGQRAIELLDDAGPRGHVRIL